MLSDVINQNLSNELLNLYKNANLNFPIDFPYVVQYGIAGLGVEGYSFTVPKEDSNGAWVPKPLYDFYIDCFQKIRGLILDA